MAEMYMGQIWFAGFNFSVQNNMFCSGQTLAISQYTALFALIGTYYGGNGVSTFQLPNLGGRVPIGMGQSPGTSQYVIGQVAGVENTTLLQSQMPAHTHIATFTPTGTTPVQPINVTATLQATTGAATETSAPAAGSMLGTAKTAAGAQPQLYVPSGTTGTPVNIGGLSVTATGGGGGGISGGTVTNSIAGSNSPVSLLQPYIALNPQIVIYGLFPPRN